MKTKEITCDGQAVSYGTARSVRAGQTQGPSHMEIKRNHPWWHGSCVRNDGIALSVEQLYDLVVCCLSRLRLLGFIFSRFQKCWKRVRVRKLYSFNSQSLYIAEGAVGDGGLFRKRKDQSADDVRETNDEAALRLESKPEERYAGGEHVEAQVPERRRCRTLGTLLQLR